MSEVILKEPKFEARIGGEWLEVLSINYCTYRPSISYYTPPKKGYCGCQTWNWPLKGTKIRVVGDSK